MTQQSIVLKSANELRVALWRVTSDISFTGFINEVAHLAGSEAFIPDELGEGVFDSLYHHFYSMDKVQEQLNSGMVKKWIDALVGDNSFSQAAFEAFKRRLEEENKFVESSG